MDIEKLIERLYTKQQSYAAYTDSELAHVLEDASTALSTLQAENEMLREKIEDARLEGYAKGLGEMSEENEKLRADVVRFNDLLASYQAERDAAVESIPHECKICIYYTVSFNGCTPDHDCTNPDGGCSNNYDRWQWRGIKED